ncbi:MAG: glucose-6-phosphate isomerase [Deltaproteobacteria bacterium]|jgi:glucose-6-phosphate isomerase|nr:glucose-6-phosphate isomerase [Deltaproteobacteria bacterium]
MPDKKTNGPANAVREEAEEFLTLDYNNLTSEALGEGKGLDQEDLNELKGLLNAAHKDVEARYKKGSLPFMDLPKSQDTPKAARKLAEMGRKKFENIVVLGIGGSALGTSAIFTALKPLNHNGLSTPKRSWPRLVVADNIDPEGFSAILEQLDLKTSFFNVISKSGATAETMSQFMIVYDQLRRTLGKSAIKDRLLITTDPENGVLRKIVDSEGFMSLPVPPGVGGRFSVLTAVGLAPLAMVGVNVTDLLAGAARAQEDARKPPPGNKAYAFAGLNYLLNVKKKKNALVMMPYSDALARVSDWFGQLWNESLGKATRLDGAPNPHAQTAYKAVGATDQHSQLQMYMEGTDEKTICFLGVENFRTQVNIPTIFKEHEELSYLGGHNLGELLNFERLGTARALTENGKANFGLILPKISTATVGYLIHTLEVATVASGSLYGINPLDQPGVELGKKFTYGLMGRTGFGEFRERYDKGFSNKKKYVVKTPPPAPVKKG